jgi:glycerol-3-phosphate acyltransferase PlsY
MREAGLIIFSYLVGSIPFSYVMGRLFGKIDIRQHGAQKVSPSNVFQTVGKVPGTIAGIADVLKGTAMVLLARKLQMPELVVALCGLAAIAGHDWPIYLRFYGGRGIGTSMGVLFIMAPRAAAIIVISLLVGKIARNTGIGTVIGVLLLPLAALILHYSPTVFFLTVGILLLAFFSRVRAFWRVKENRRQVFWNRLIRDSNR